MNSKQRRAERRAWLHDPQNRKEVQTLLGALLIGERVYSTDMTLAEYRVRVEAVFHAEDGKLLDEWRQVTDKGIRYFRGEI